MQLLQTLSKKFGLGTKEKMKHHFVFIEVPKSVVGPEITFWGEASWWPAECSLEFTRKTLGELKEGTRYDQKFTGPFPMRTEMEVTKLVPQHEIERTFRGGAFRGRENITIEGRYNGTKVHYHMRYRIHGILNKILWAFVFKGVHSKNINMILESLKKHVEKKEGVEAE